MQFWERKQTLQTVNHFPEFISISRLFPGWKTGVQISRLFQESKTLCEPCVNDIWDLKRRCKIHELWYCFTSCFGPLSFLGNGVVMAALQAVLTLPCTNPSNNRVKMYIKISCFFQRMGLFNASQFFCNVFAKYIKYKKKKKKKPPAFYAFLNCALLYGSFKVFSPVLNRYQHQPLRLF